MQRKCKNIYYLQGVYRNNRMQHQQEVPTNNLSPPSSPKKKKQKRAAVTVLLVDPLHLVMPVEQPPLYENNLFPSMTGLLPWEDMELEHEPGSTVGEASRSPHANTGAKNDTGTGFFKPPLTAEEAQLAFNDLRGSSDHHRRQWVTKILSLTLSFISDSRG
jgi:hypothetical protein